MASNQETNQSDGGLDDDQAASSVDDTGSRQEEAPRISESQHLLASEPSHSQGTVEKSTRPRFERNPCPLCNISEEDWQRNVHFAVQDAHGGERAVLGAGLFDTGTEVYNFMSSNFAREFGIAFEDCTDVDETLPWWKQLFSKLCGDPSRAMQRTIDGSPIKTIGVVKGQRWRGVEEERCTKGVSFTPQFLKNDFLVVENLAYDAIFSSKTMNHHRLRGNCSQAAAFRGKKPDPTKDVEALKKWEEEREEQERIQREQERKREQQRRNPPNA